MDDQQHEQSWSYRDSTGAVAGITRVVVLDRSSAENGLLRWIVKGKGGTASLPDVSAVRSTIVLGDADECAALVWNPANGARPRCEGDAAALRCR